MLKLFRSKTFLKEYKNIKFTDKLYFKYMMFVTTLLREEKLPVEALDHSIKGQYLKYREFHISGDLLIIYNIDEETLKLICIGSHTKLFE